MISLGWMEPIHTSYYLLPSVFHKICFSPVKEQRLHKMRDQGILNLNKLQVLQHCHRRAILLVHTVLFVKSIVIANFWSN